ncbi:acyl-CoA dehydrogenase [Advenella faeciporci]|uniref:Acyl-CoA dehydrogenase n=1 Tax=Advenella faeciporci TaxID=797535 RepID=A0A918JKE0_9BURK|nr:acyl-CoA dehydrogenase [Advenella faeciporci]GGW80218.1 acyl-CoA dehydrogenase [Advenella faeciporci]
MDNSSMDNLFDEAVGRLFADISEKYGNSLDLSSADYEAIWSEIAASGFLDVMLTEEKGGAGLSLKEAGNLFKLEGYFNLPVPFASTLLARGWLDNNRLTVPDGSIAIATMGVKVSEGQGRIVINKLPFGHQAASFLVLANQRCYLLTQEKAVVNEVYHAGLFASVSWRLEETIELDVSARALDELLNLASLATLLPSVGAMEKIFEMTLEYANQRQQFGRPLSKFQAIQHQISVLAEHVWAARMAAQIACNSNNNRSDPNLLAIAKYQVSFVSDQVADIAHAVHGAIGITEEYALHFYTRRVREFRSEAGTQSCWAKKLGHHVLGQEGETVFSMLTGELCPGW